MLYGLVAQLVEHLLCKQGVVGSNPTVVHKLETNKESEFGDKKPCVKWFTGKADKQCPAKIISYVSRLIIVVGGLCYQVTSQILICLLLVKWRNW